MAEVFRQLWRTTDKPSRMTIPLHGGVLELTMPVGFVPAFRVEQDGAFMMAFVPDGEAFPQFSRALLIQSSATLGSAPDADTQIAEIVYKPRICIGDALWQAVGERAVSAQTKAFVAATGCPALQQEPSTGQQTFFAFVRRKPHAFAVSYTVRSPAFAAASPPIPLDQTEAQLRQLGDLIFCEAPEQPVCRDILARDAIRRNAR
jgi:hypothetical protein